MGWSKFFKGEPMPDRDDPKYQKRHEQMYSAGNTFARVTGLTWIGCKIVNFANAHKKLYIALVLGFAVFVFLFQVWTFVKNYSNIDSYAPVSERVDSALQDRFHQSSNIKILEYEKTDSIP